MAAVSGLKKKMKRQENPAADLPVPVFDLRKQSRIPITFAPAGNEFLITSEYDRSTNLAPPTSGGPALAGSVGPASPVFASGAFGAQPFTGCQSSPLSYDWDGIETSQLGSLYRFASNRFIPGVPERASLKPLWFPFEPGTWSPQMEEPGNLVRQYSSSVGDLSPKTFQHSGIGGIPQGMPNLQAGFSEMAGQSARELLIPRNQYPIFQQPYRCPKARAEKRANSTLYDQPPAKKLWKFNYVDHSTYMAGKSSGVMPPSVMVKTPAEPVSDNSMKILTVDIEGMKNWSQFKDKTPIMFEIFGTLNSTVTEGQFGVKNFLISDGRQVVKCAFYENDEELPHLIRYNLVRCIGQYDRTEDVLTCVLVQPGRPAEVRNSSVVVEVCDAEMDALVWNFSEA